MTNREWLSSMADEELAEWLCKQIWAGYGNGGPGDAMRFNSVRNFLKMPHRGDAAEKEGEKA